MQVIKKNRRLLIFLLTPICLLIVGTIIIYVLKRMECKRLNCIDFPGKKTYLLEEEYESTGRSYRALFQKGAEKIRAEYYAGVSPEQARDFNQYKTMQLLGLYETVKSPYPGVLSDRITCDDAYKPVFRTETKSRVVYTGYLNDRLQYGTCEDGQIAYKSLGIMTYCPGQKIWYYLEFIEPKKDSLPIALIKDSIRCL